MLFLGPSIEVLYLIVALLIALDIHECSHAWVANALGDPSAKNAGRMSLNPLRHLHPIGTLLLLFVGLGWGKPVPVDARRLRLGPKWGMALVGAAGPASNFLLAMLLAVPLRLRLPIFTPHEIGNTGIWISYGLQLSWLLWLSLALAIFNMIPFTPLDGSRILAAFLPDRWFYTLARYERYAFLLFIVLILLERFTQVGILANILFPPIKFLWWQLTNLTPPFPF